MHTKLDSDDDAQKCYGHPSLDSINDPWYQSTPVTTMSRTHLQSFQVVAGAGGGLPASMAQILKAALFIGISLVFKGFQDPTG